MNNEDSYRPATECTLADPSNVGNSPASMPLAALSQQQRVLSSIDPLLIINPPTYPSSLSQLAYMTQRLWGFVQAVDWSRSVHPKTEYAVASRR